MYLISCWRILGVSTTFMPQSFSTTVVSDWLGASCVACPGPRACNVRGSVKVTHSVCCGCFAVARMEGELNDIEALKDLKVELISQKEVS